jgi:MATE family multidrug resistance protein
MSTTHPKEPTAGSAAAGQDGRATTSWADRHRRIWQLAGPVILSNVTTPMLGAVDTAVVGRLPDPALIGGVALGAMIFNFVFWAFGFLRMGTTGFSAQAAGAGDAGELRAAFLRALMLAGGIGIALVLLQDIIGLATFSLVQGSAAVKGYAHAYYAIRIWSAPAALGSFAVLGWLLGTRRTGLALALQIGINGTNVLLAVLFVLVFGWGIRGVAAATVTAELLGAVVGLTLVLRLLPSSAAPGLFDRRRLWRLLKVNGDIMLRTLCLQAAFVVFTLTAAGLGDITLAANAILLNLLTIMAYGLDGFAMAAEILVGRSIGARDRIGFRTAVGDSTLWAAGLAVLAALFFLAAGRNIVNLFTVHQAVRDAAAIYLPWLALAPLLAVWCYQLDGIYIGATRTIEMRNGMIVALVGYLGALWLGLPHLGNHALWLALMVFFVLRAATLALWLPRIDRSLVA